MGAGSAHKSFFASRASFSSPSSKVSAGAYFRFHQHHVSGAVRSGRNCCAHVRVDYLGSSKEEACHAPRNVSGHRDQFRTTLPGEVKSRWRLLRGWQERSVTVPRYLLYWRKAPHSLSFGCSRLRGKSTLSTPVIAGIPRRVSLSRPLIPYQSAYRWSVYRRSCPWH